MKLSKLVIFLFLFLSLTAALVYLKVPHNLFSNAIVKARPCGYDGLTCCSQLDKNLKAVYTCPNSIDSALCYNAGVYTEYRLRADYQCKTLKDVCGTKIGSPCCEDMTCGSNTNLKCLKYPFPYAIQYDKGHYTNPWAAYYPSGGLNNPDRWSFTNKSVGVCGKSDTLPTPQSQLNTCGGTNEPCCPGNLCDVKSPLNVCLEASGLNLCKPIKPINNDPPNVHLSIEIFRDNYSSFLFEDGSSNIGLHKPVLSDFFEASLYVSSNIFLPDAQDFIQSYGRLFYDSIIMNYSIKCNDNHFYIDYKPGNNKYFAFTCSYRADELTKEVHLSIKTTIEVAYVGYTGILRLPETKRTFHIYDADSIITSTPTPTPPSNSTIAPSPLPTSSPTLTPQPGGSCNPPCRVDFTCNAINKCVKK